MAKLSAKSILAWTALVSQHGPTTPKNNSVRLERPLTLTFSLRDGKEETIEVPPGTEITFYKPWAREDWVRSTVSEGNFRVGDRQFTINISKDGKRTITPQIIR